MTTTTHMGVSFLVIPLLLVPIGLILLFVRSRRRGRLAMLLAGSGLACAAAALLFVRVERQQSYSYVGDSSNSVMLSNGYAEQQRKLAEYHQAEARRQAELSESVARQYAQAEAQHLAVAQSMEQTQTAAARAYERAEAGARVAQEQAEAMVQMPDTIMLEEAPAEPWKPVAELGFDADVHPSAAAAAEALVVQMLKLKDSSHPEAAIKRVQVWGDGDIGSDTLSRVLARLQRSRPDWQVMPEAAEPDEPLERGDGEAMSIRLGWPTKSTTHQAPWDPNRPQGGGILRMRFNWQDGTIDRSTSFVEKPWVENPSEFVSAKPEMRWVIGFSSPQAADVVKARQEAVHSAAVQILPQARAEFSRGSRNLAADDRWLLSVIEREIQRMAGVRDKFTQTLVTTYGGQVAREAVLVQSPTVVQRVVRECAVQTYQERKTWFTLVASAAGMCVLVCVVGLLLNSATKGYYRGTIGAVMGLLVVIGILVCCS